MAGAGRELHFHPSQESWRPAFDNDRGSGPPVVLRYVAVVARRRAHHRYFGLDETQEISHRLIGMKFKGTAILFLMFLVLGAYVYFTEYRGQEEKQKQEEAKKKAFQVDEKDITEISLTYPDRTISAVKKGE